MSSTEDADTQRIADTKGLLGCAKLSIGILSAFTNLLGARRYQRIVFENQSYSHLPLRARDRVALFNLFSLSDSLGMKSKGFHLLMYNQLIYVI